MNQQIPPDIRNYLDSMLQETDMITLDEKMREDMIQELFYQLDNYLASIIIDNLSPEDTEAFIKMNEEKKSKEEIEKFVNEKMPDADRIFSDAFLEFRKMYVNNISTARDKQLQN